MNTPPSKTKWSQNSQKQSAIKNLAIGTALAVGTAISSYAILKKSPAPDHIESISELKPSAPNEIMNNFKQSYAIVFTSMTQPQSTFLDCNGRFFGAIIDRKDCSKDDDVCQQENQKLYDDTRKKISEAHDIPATEQDMIIASARNNQPLAFESYQNMNKKVIKRDETRVQYLLDLFQNISNDTVIDAEIHNYIVGLVAAESGFNNELVSGSGAQGAMQLMPWLITQPAYNPFVKNFEKEFGRQMNSEEKKKEVELIRKSFAWQVMVAREFMKELATNLHRNHTKEVANRYFGGDEESAKRYFIVPLIFNAYNGGQPLMDAAMKEFYVNYPDKKSVEIAMKRQYDSGFGRDLFWFFTKASTWVAVGKEWSQTVYGSDSGKYTVQAFAMQDAIDNIDTKKYKQYTPYTKSHNHSCVTINRVEKVLDKK